MAYLDTRRWSSSAYLLQNLVSRTPGPKSSDHDYASIGSHKRDDVSLNPLGIEFFSCGILLDYSCVGPIVGFSRPYGASERVAAHGHGNPSLCRYPHCFVHL